MISSNMRQLAKFVWVNLWIMYMSRKVPIAATGVEGLSPDNFLSFPNSVVAITAVRLMSRVNRIPPAQMLATKTGINKAAVIKRSNMDSVQY